MLIVSIKTQNARDGLGQLCIVSRQIDDNDMI